MSGPRTPPTPLPKPAEVVLYDFRPPAHKREAVPADRPVKLVQWNIERGYKLDAIIAELKALDADVLALQEIDIHCERSGWVDTGREIAQALGLAYAFVCEFEELHSPLRAPDSQGGGVHGNAILSKYDITDARAVEHRVHPIDWELPPASQPHKLAAKEPRRGRRLTAAATVVTHQGPLLVYSAHLECFCGALGRMAQVSDLFRDTRQWEAAQRRLHIAVSEPPPPVPPAPEPEALVPPPTRIAPPTLPSQEQQQGQQGQEEQRHSPAAAAPLPSPPPPLPLPAALLGDLNTLGNGVARLSPHYCTDWLRWGSLGWFEAELLAARVLAVTDPAPVNAWAVRQGLPEELCRDLVNPGYEDPFDARRDITFDHAKYRWFGQHLMTGKFDWALLRGVRVVGRRMGNHDYSASDHKWLEVAVHLVGPRAGVEGARE